MLLSSQQLLDLLQVSVNIRVLTPDHKGNFPLHLGNIADDLTGVVMFTGDVSQYRPYTDHGNKETDQGESAVERNQKAEIILGYGVLLMLRKVLQQA
jgi:hypothetical protein